LVAAPGPVGILGFRSTVGDAVAQLLGSTCPTYVEASGAADERRAREIGVLPASQAEILARCRTVVGAVTTGPALAPSALRPGTTLVDLALPALLQPGPLPPGVRVVAGETVSWPGTAHLGGWGRLWRFFAGYERGSVYACVAEPVAAAATNSAPWSAGRKLSRQQLLDVGSALLATGFTPIVRARRR
jgi:predicted amino acid dehydrogenase